MSAQFRDDARHLATAPVVVGVDGSEAAEAAVAWAAETAAQRGRELRIVHGVDLKQMRRVFEPYDVIEPSVLEKMRARGADLVARSAQNARASATGLRVRTEVSEVDPVRVLLEYGKTAHLVALGASGATGLAAHAGSTMLAVASHAEGVVVVVRGDPEAGGRVRREGPVVVGLDCGPTGEPALGVAFEEAAERRAELMAVHVWDEMNAGSYADDLYALYPVPDIEVREQALVAERLAGWLEKYPEVVVNRRVYSTDAAATLLAWSESAQLVVSGSRGRGRLRSLLFGSTSNALVQHARCPVMVVHDNSGSQSLAGAQGPERGRHAALLAEKRRGDYM